MSTPLKQALIEAAWLIQAFVASFEAWRINRFFEGWSGAYLLSPFTGPPLIALIIMYLIFIQLRISNATKFLMFQLEIGKSVLVSTLWLALFMTALVQGGLYKFLISLMAVVVVVTLFYSTLVVAYLDWKRERVHI